jgi:hypothetical protein
MPGSNMAESIPLGSIIIREYLRRAVKLSGHWTGTSIWLGQPAAMILVTAWPGDQAWSSRVYVTRRASRHLPTQTN